MCASKTSRDSTTEPTPFDQSTNQRTDQKDSVENIPDGGTTQLKKREIHPAVQGLILNQTGSRNASIQIKVQKLTSIYQEMKNTNICLHNRFFQ